jgi:exodeoxyribonuclease V beta subunit
VGALAPEPSTFDPCAPIPAGTTVLEASAGTGKTHTITQLAVRAVALDGLPLDRLLAVTFTRAATGELRERIRARLARSERLLREGRTADGDAVDALLAEGTEDEVRERCGRLRRALADFDAATIVTLDGFAFAVLGTLGVAGDLDPDPRVVEEVDDLREQVVLDLHLLRFRSRPRLFGLKEARAVVRRATELPEAVLRPADTRDFTSRPETLARLAERARTELGDRKRRARLLTFDDLMLRLRAALRSEDGEALCARLRDQWSLVLVDEFQDTDPVQWEVLEQAFAGPGSATRLVLIGDPKQAIYAFRGADVRAYLRALGTAGTVRELRTNWRSDAPLIAAHDALLGGVQLGSPEIPYRTVEAHFGRPRLHRAPERAALAFRVVDRGHPAIEQTRYGYVQVDSGRAMVARDCAAQIAELLASGAEIEPPDEPRRAVRPEDVAVLCRKSRNAQAVQDELAALGVPAVLGGAGSVFATAAATDWLRLLEALERPGWEGAARLAALTPFLGWDAARLCAASPDDLEAVHAKLHAWARVLRGPGVAALHATITAEEGLPRRVLATRGGERALTDLRHVAELLHREGTSGALGATALATWLRRRIREARTGEEDRERTRRLESDRRAVQLLTVHGAKGLEFGVVHLPDLWDVTTARSGAPVAFHDGGRRVLDVSLEGREHHAALGAWRAEERAEELRLLYVALTRARHQAVVWWAGAAAASGAPLTRLLLDRRPDGALGPGPDRTPADAAMLGALEELASSCPEISVATVETTDPPRYAEPPAAPAELAARRFDRPIDHAWRRTSYSALAAGARETRVAVGTEVEDDLLADEPPEDELLGAEGGSALATMPGGRDVGTVVHRVLERADLAAGDLEGELERELTEATARSGVELGPLDAVAADLAIALRTPVLDGRAVTATEDRLDELVFELPLAGGDVPAGDVTLGRLAAALHEHLAEGDPVRAYADVLAQPGLGPPFRGFLTGSIDLVARWEHDGVRRYALYDYKTNRLPSYEPSALHAEMAEAHYWLQALIYLVALHRHLRAREPGYDADRQLAGAAYLFLRGMPEAGVVTWSPSGALLDALSEVLG